jgi:hypothetical protein
MSRSRHFRRILAAGVVASLSITWGAGVAFATDSPAPIDQSNSIGVTQNGCGDNEYPTVAPPPGQGEPIPIECGVADANTGENLQVTGGQANITGQADLSVATGSVHHEETMDAFALGLIFAVAIGGDATAGAANWASSDNDLTLNNTLHTGDAVAGNAVHIDGSQANSNTGTDLAIGFGSGVSAISQSNAVGIGADDNSAFANSGGNVQASGGQLNLTGQLALAGAQGSPGLALALGVGIAAGGDALASAGNTSTHTCCGDPDNFNNFQNVTNDMTTGAATAVNSVQLGSPAVKDNPDTPADETKPADPFTQLNDNTGNAYTLVGADLISFAGAFIVQSNTIEVDPSGNEAIANSGYNLQASGPQLNGNLQLAGAGAGGGWAGSVGLLGLALAFGGDAGATAGNVADSGNGQTVSNHLVTGDAIAQNFTGVLATQTNTNSGNAGALDIYALIGIGVGGIVQYNGVYVEANENTAEATTGYNAQIGGFQGNGTIQGAGAIAGGGWAGALGAFALAKAGDATAAAANLSGSKNDSTVSNSLETGDAQAANVVNLNDVQSNTNSGWAAGATALDLFGVGVGFVYQGNAAYSDASGNFAYADTGTNVQGTLGQGNLTLQGGIALAGGGDAVSAGLLAGAVAGDATALAGNTASSSNHQKVDNKATTGVADAENDQFVTIGQSNTNNGGEHHQGNAVGIAALVYAGVGIGFIAQGNDVAIYGDDNVAVANSGYNAQFSGPQVNITGQLALAGAQGGGALSLALIGAGAFGGDAASAAANVADSTNWQLVCNELVTGMANALNLIAVTATQANTNGGDAAGVVLAIQPVLTIGAINQSNNLTVSHDDNVAIANSGDNLQAAGGQANVTVQVAADGSEAGGSAALALGGAVAVDGDATGSAGNIATSDNTTLANNDMTTGDAKAVNQVQVDVTQDNHNDGDATAVGL